MAFVTPTNYALIEGPEELTQPFSVGQYGEISSTQDQSISLKWHVLSLLLTNPGERVMRPDYGVGLFGFVFENDDPVAVAGYQARINEQVGLYEPSVSVQAVTVQQNQANPGEADISLTYTIRNTQQSMKTVVNTNGQVVETL